MSLKSVGTYKDTTLVMLTHPATGEPLMHDGKQMSIEIYGKYSSHFKAISNARSNARIQKAQRTGGRGTLTAEQIQADELATLVKCVKDWYMAVDDKGGLTELSEENVRKVFVEFPWVREQVELAFEDNRAFLD